MSKKETGMEYEQLACASLQKQGFTIKERNFRCRQGEIDIVGFHQGYLVFVEVKFRTSARRGYAEEAVTPEKQRRICKAAQYYLLSHGYSEGVPVRYDVIAFTGGSDQMTWHKNAFDHRF